MFLALKKHSMGAVRPVTLAASDIDVQSHCFLPLNGLLSAIWMQHVDPSV
jgi:hypothetical protein